MNTKILLIGQAPPAQKQIVPYDTTLLYEILGRCGISKEQAQELFDFEAISDKFPGFDRRGAHLPPSREDADRHWKDTLEAKVANAKVVILLGNVAKNEFYNRGIIKAMNYGRIDSKFIFWPHPSKRNTGLILFNMWMFKDTITWLKETYGIN